MGINQGADLRGVGLELGSLGSYLHGVGHRPHLHFEAKACRLIEHEGDWRLDRSFKTGCLRFHLIGSDGEIGEIEDTTLRCFGGGGTAALGVPCGNSRIVDSCAACVCNRAGDRRGYLLRPRGLKNAECTQGHYEGYAPQGRSPHTHLQFFKRALLAGKIGNSCRPLLDPEIYFSAELYPQPDWNASSTVEKKNFF